MRRYGATMPRPETSKGSQACSILGDRERTAERLPLVQADFASGWHSSRFSRKNMYVKNREDETGEATSIYTKYGERMTAKGNDEY
jgi:hypothetical protein